MHMGKRFGIPFGAALTALIALSPLSHADEAKSTGHTTWIGVTVRPLSDAIRDQWDYRGAGVMVTAVAPGSAAELAGVVRGDVLVVLGSVSLRSESDFTEAQARLAPGEPISVVIAREKGRIINIVNLDIEEPPAPEPIALPEKIETPSAETAVVTAPAEPRARAVERAPFGVRGEALSPPLAAALGVSASQGVLVLDVVSGSPGDLAGIRAGDVISRAAGQAVASAQDLDRALAGAEGPTVVRIHRQKDERDLQVYGTTAAPAVVDPARDAERDRVIQELREKVRELKLEILRLRTELEGVKSEQSL